MRGWESLKDYRYASYAFVIAIWGSGVSDGSHFYYFFPISDGEVLDRGYGRSVELKRTLTTGAFDGYSDADLDELIARLDSIGQVSSLRLSS
jgi:hypothetical protein